jgi:hypothetical protein
MVTGILHRLAVFAVLTTLALTTVACATAAKDTADPAAGAPRSSAFDAWAEGNGTGAFFKAVGPAGGTGVR